MRLRVAWWVGLWGVVWAAPALADEANAKAPGKVEYSAELLGGYGVGNQFEDDNKNRYGLALGVRAGLTLAAPRLHFGLSFLHFNGSDGPAGRRYTNTLDTELGYDFRLLKERLLIRPALALGVAQAVTIQSDNAGYPLVFHWAPGILVGARLAPLLLTAEYRYDLVPDSWPSSNTLLFGVGFVL